MFRLLFKKLRLLGLLSLLSLFAAPVAYADATAPCFNLLGAKNYASAETEAKVLLQRTDLSRTEQTLAQECLGIAYDRLEQTQEALKPFLQAEALAQTTQELATIYNWLGLFYRKLENLERAELYFQRARKAHKELGDKSSEAGSLVSLARVAQKRGEVERALAFYQESLALEPDEAKKLTTMNNIAQIYSDRKQYKQAVVLFRKAIKMAKKNGDSHQAAILQINLGKSFQKQGKLVPAETELTAGLNAALLLDDKTLVASAYQYLAEVAIARKQMTVAIELYSKLEALYRKMGETDSADLINITIEMLKFANEAGAS